MHVPDLNSWPSDTTAARTVQKRLRGRVVTEDRLGRVRTVAGIDVGFERHGRTARAAAVVLDFPTLTVREQVVARTPTRFPYVPGLLSFREIPAVLAALKKLHTAPDLILCDGQGYAHPRRFGLACHLGVLLDVPTIGVAKSRLVGAPRGVLGSEKGSWVPLVDALTPGVARGSHPHSLSRREKPHPRHPWRAALASVPLAREASRGARRAQEEIIGAVLRTRDGVKPLYVSIGHRVSLGTAIDYVLACCPRYRLPETTRLAHLLASG